MKKNLIILLTIVIGIGLLGCYTNTVDSLSTFKFQLPVYFYKNWVDRFAPDTSWDFTNLNDYPEYRDNKDKIQIAEILSFNYWVDSLVTANGVPYNPNDKNSPVIEFKFVKFYLHFAVWRDNPPNPNDPSDSSNYVRDPDTPDYLLGEFYNVNVKDYYRNPEHILEVPTDVAKIISLALKAKPHFFIKAVYSKTKDQKVPKLLFPLINSRYDLVFRFKVSL